MLRTSRKPVTLFHHLEKLPQSVLFGHTSAFFKRSILELEYDKLSRDLVCLLHLLASYFSQN